MEAVREHRVLNMTVKWCRKAFISSHIYQRGVYALCCFRSLTLQHTNTSKSEKLLPNSGNGTIWGPRESQVSLTKQLASLSCFLVSFSVSQLHRYTNLLPRVLYSSFMAVKLNLRVHFSCFCDAHVCTIVPLRDWNQICKCFTKTSSYLSTHTHVIHIFMRSGLCSVANRADLRIISILHGKLMSGGHAHWSQGDTIHSFTLWEPVGVCAVSLSLELLAPCSAIWPLCQTTPGIFRRAPTLCAQTWSTHARPRQSDSEPPGWEERGEGGNRKTAV